MMIVTIKNEEAVEMVLKSTCESSWFLVTKINWCFYFLQSEIVSGLGLRPHACLPALGKDAIVLLRGWPFVVSPNYSFSLASLVT